MGRVITSTAGLTASGDGDFVTLRVGTYPELHQIGLYYEAASGRWVSQPIRAAAVNSKDGNWSNLNSGASTQWSYLAAVTDADSGWFLRASAIPFASALIAAGLTLQDRMVARMAPSSGTTKVAAWFYEFDSDAQLVLDNDKTAGSFPVGSLWNGAAVQDFPPSSANIGHGCVLASDGTATARFYGNAAYEDDINTSGYHGLSRSVGWDDVKFFVASTPSGLNLGGVPTTTPWVPSKKFLYPTLYAKSGSSNARIANLAYWVRWVI